MLITTLVFFNVFGCDLSRFPFRKRRGFQRGDREQQHLSSLAEGLQRGERYGEPAGGAMERKGTVKMVGKYDLRILLENCWKTVGKLLENCWKICLISWTIIVIYSKGFE